MENIENKILLLLKIDLIIFFSVIPKSTDGMWIQQDWALYKMMQNLGENNQSFGMIHIAWNGLV